MAGVSETTTGTSRSRFTASTGGRCEFRDALAEMVAKQADDGTIGRMGGWEAGWDGEEYHLCWRKHKQCAVDTVESAVGPPALPENALLETPREAVVREHRAPEPSGASTALAYGRAADAIQEACRGAIISGDGPAGECHLRGGSRWMISAACNIRNAQPRRLPGRKRDAEDRAAT